MDLVDINAFMDTGLRSQDLERGLNRSWIGRHGFSINNGNNTPVISDFDDLCDLDDDATSSSEGLDAAS